MPCFVNAPRHQLRLPANSNHLRHHVRRDRPQESASSTIGVQRSRTAGVDEDVRMDVRVACDQPGSSSGQVPREAIDPNAGSTEPRVSPTSASESDPKGAKRKADSVPPEEEERVTRAELDQ